MKPEKCTNSVVSLQDLCSYKAPTTNCHINNKKKRTQWKIDARVNITVWFRDVSSLCYVCIFCF